jgi:RhoGEF domain
MATTFLPPIVPSPFGKVFARKSYNFSDIGHNCSYTANDYQYSYPEDSPRTLRAASVPAAASPTVNSNKADENCGPRYRCQSRSTSPRKGASSIRTQPHAPNRSPNGPVSPKETPCHCTETFPVFEDSRVSFEHPFSELQYHTGPDRSSDQSWNWQPQGSASGNTTTQVLQSSATTFRQRPLAREVCEDKTAPTIALDKSLGKTAVNFRRWASTFRHRRGQTQQNVQAQVSEEGLQTDTASALPNVSFRPQRHRTRVSNASSRFVATVKTASLSNDSMSMLPLPHRYSRLSDARVNRNSDPRSSVDSQRPSSISSSDEGALRRSMKRRQILQEVLNSEESYVADLKALHNLFSTLLASIPSISAQTRNSIQRNVTEMLHLHEQIVNELHRVALRATLREWKYVASPSRPSTWGHRKWQSFDDPYFNAPTMKPHHTVTSPDFMKARTRGASTYGADPVEVADVARIFRTQLPRFFVYEEYCAKYEVMVQELLNSHKMVTQWSSYEVGMEALANSIASLNHRVSDGKKGLTTGDLLVKPIQRICKYPLLFGDLHKHTPVVDCPSSHAEVDGILNNLREMVKEINLATDDPRVRDQIQRRWLLQDRLKLGPGMLQATQFRALGHVVLCGVLHVAYQTSSRVEGRYMLCMMFKDYLLVAATAPEHGRFDVVATIYLSDAKVVPPEDGRGNVNFSSQSLR